MTFFRKTKVEVTEKEEMCGVMDGGRSCSRSYGFEREGLDDVPIVS